MTEVRPQPANVPLGGWRRLDAATVKADWAWYRKWLKAEQAALAEPKHT